MSNPRARYPEEFKAEVVQLARSYPEKFPRQLSRELGISDQTLHIWVKISVRSARFARTD